MNKFIAISISIILNYVDLKQYPDWLIGFSLRLMITVTEILSVFKRQLKIKVSEHRKNLNQDSSKHLIVTNYMLEFSYIWLGWCEDFLYGTDLKC